MGDLDADGKPDLIAANNGPQGPVQGNTLTIFTGNAQVPSTWA